MQFFSQLNSETQIFLVAIFSIIFGSFASLVTCRLASDEPIMLGRSKCPNCNVNLKIRNLIPLFSWLFQKGKCSNCHTKISLRYPLIELSFLVSFLIVYFVLGQEITPKTLLYFAITGTLIVMCITDLEHYFIPNSTQYFLAILATILVISEGGTNAALINIKSAVLYTIFGLALWAFFYLTAKVEAIGVDDIKFFFTAGLMLGAADFLNFMFLSGFFGMIFGGLWQKFKNEKTFPFAPAICASTFVCLLFDKKINPVDLIGSLLFFQTF